MLPAIYLFVDGMTESGPRPTSLDLAATPTIDALLSCGEAGLYLPPIAPGHSEPQTDVVIPSFFGLRPDQHPGRPALELIDLGIEVTPATFSFFVSLNSVEEVSFASDVARHLVMLAAECGGVCVESIAFNYGHRWIVGNVDRHGLAEFRAAIESAHYPIPLDIEEVAEAPGRTSTTPYSKDKINFLGWAKGGLRGAFKVLGAQCNPYNRPPGIYGDWQGLAQDYESYIEPMLTRSLREFETHVLYTKETAFASRHGDRETKIRGIEFMDRILGRALQIFNSPCVVLVASDHSCNVGNLGNPPENTSFVLSRLDDVTKLSNRAGANFCEESAIQASNGNALSVHELAARIRNLRS